MNITGISHILSDWLEKSTESVENFGVRFEIFCRRLFQEFFVQISTDSNQCWRKFCRIFSPLFFWQRQDLCVSIKGERAPLRMQKYIPVMTVTIFSFQSFQELYKCSHKAFSVLFHHHLFLFNFVIVLVVLVVIVLVVFY